MYQNGYNPFEQDSYRNAMCAEAKRSFSRFGLALFFYLLSAYLIGILAEIVLLVAFKENAASIASNVYYKWIMGVLPMYAVGLPILYLIVRNMPKKTIKKSSMDIGEFLILFAISQTLMYAGNLIGTMLNGFLGALTGNEINNATSELIEDSPVWLTLIIAVIIGPVVEEFIFRKLMIDRLSRFGNTFAIVVSSVAFGLFHGNFYQFFYSAFLGVLLGYIAVKTGNWLYSVAMHVIINFFGSVAVMPILDLSNDYLEFTEALLNGEDVNMRALLNALMAVTSYSIVNYAVVLFGAFLIIRIIQKKLYVIKSDAEVNIAREDVSRAVVGNVGAVLYLMATLLIFAMSIFL